MSHAADSNPMKTGHRERLRQKYIRAGADSFHDYELIELLLTYAIQRRDVKPIAKALFHKFKTLQNMVDADLKELKQVEGLGDNSALLLKLIRELSVFYLSAKIEKRDVIASSEDFSNFARMKLGGLQEEQMLAIYLDSNNQIIEYEVTATGSVDYVTVYPRKILEQVILHKATGLLLAHNHPTGSLSPSANDLTLTRQIAEVIKPLGVRLRDHVIVSKTSCFSLTLIPSLMKMEVLQ